MNAKLTGISKDELETAFKEAQKGKVKKLANLQKMMKKEN